MKRNIGLVLLTGMILAGCGRQMESAGDTTQDTTAESNFRKATTTYLTAMVPPMYGMRFRGQTMTVWQ